MKAEWEEVADSYGVATERLRVPSGWIYRTCYEDGVAMVFVPDPKQKRA